MRIKTFKNIQACILAYYFGLACVVCSILYMFIGQAYMTGFAISDRLAENFSIIIAYLLTSILLISTPCHIRRFFSCQ